MQGRLFFKFVIFATLLFSFRVMAFDVHAAVKQIKAHSKAQQHNVSGANNVRKNDLLGRIIQAKLRVNAERDVIASKNTQSFTEHSLQKKDPRVNQCQSLLLRIKYRSAAAIYKSISSAKGLLSKQDKAIVNPATNSIWLHDCSHTLEQIKSYLNFVDVQQPQIKIKAKIIDTDEQSLRDLGLDFVMTQTGNEEPEHGYSVMVPDTASMLGVVQFPLIKLGPGADFDLKLSALQHRGRIKLIASPELMTINRKMASIQSGEEVPYQQATTSGATSVAFKQANLMLQVTPTILPHKQVRLLLLVKHDQVTETLVNGAPMIRTRQLKTQVTLRAGQTLVLGGIYRSADSKRQASTPGLASIPLLGWLFRHNVHSSSRQQLLIFVTPTVVTG